MDTNPSAVQKLSPLQRLVYWIKLRESIRKGKEAGHAQPWTTDYILATYRFCNVRRMDDAVSRWLYDNWYRPHHGHKHMLYAVGFARYFNNPDTLKEIGPYLFVAKYEAYEGGVPWQAITQKIKQRRDKGNRVFNPAYIVSTNGRKMDKVDAAVGYVGGLWKAEKNVQAVKGYDTTASMETTHAELMRCDGVASFMAGQLVADLRWAVPGTWADRHTWAPVGPGSARGLARLLYRRDEMEVVAAGYKRRPEDWLSDFREHVLGKLPSLLPREISDRLEAHDYQNCLCELDKYERCLWGEGKPKQLYRGE